jgi:hypothetical protein
MRCLIRLISVLVGLVLLASAAVVIWVAHGPQVTEAVTTGGVSYTQQEIAAGAEIQASVDADFGTGGPALIESDIQLSDEASADLQAEAAAPPPPPPSAPEMAPLVGEGEAIPLTTDVVIDESTAVQVAPIATSAEFTAEGQGGATGTAGGYEQRVVEVEWPDQFQVGRGGLIRIKLKMLEGGALQPVAEIEENEILATPILITDRYDTHNAFVRSNLSAPDFSVQATSPFRQQLLRGGEVEWRYTLESNSSQRSVISIGLTISWDPIDQATTAPGPQNVPIWGQTLAVDVNYVFGLITVPQASIAGTALAVVGFLAEAPLLSTVLEYFLERLLKGGDRREKRQRRNRRSRRR